MDYDSGKCLTVLVTWVMYQIHSLLSGYYANCCHNCNIYSIVRVDSGSATKAVVLQSSTWYDDTGFVPAGYITDHGKLLLVHRDVKI